MSRFINETIVDDSYLIECPADEKVVFFHSLIKANKIGIYPQSALLASVLAGTTKDRWYEILKKFEADGKIIYHFGYIIICNHYKYYNLSNPKYATRAKKEIESLPPQIREHQQANLIVNRLEAIVNETLNDCQSIDNKPRNIDNQSLPIVYTSSRTPAPAPESKTPTLIPTLTNTSTPTSPLPPQRGEQKPRYIKVDGKIVDTLAGTGKEGGEEISQVQGKEGEERKKGWRPNATMCGEGVYLTEEEYLKLQDEFGEDAAMNIPDAVGQWATEKNIDVKDPYKMCRNWGLKEQKGGKRGTA